jgi:hypothetical protein
MRRAITCSPFALAAIADVLAAVGLLAGRTKGRRFI